MSRPTGLIASKGIELLTWSTPNGYKASILLEELKEAYGLQYTTQGIRIGQNIQKEPWFTAVNPNGRIPAIVDHDNGSLAVFEGNAILSYLTRRYDTERRFSFAPDDDDYTRAESWIGWQHGGVGPIQGQANHFVRFASEKIPYGMQRYVGETERLYGILDSRLKDRDYIVGPGKGKYSIADIALLGWVNGINFTTISIDQFPSVKSWLARCWERPAVQRGFTVPNPPSISSLKPQEGEAAEKTRELKKLVDQAKEQYGYKYTSP
ncbi:Glutathione transferase [Purpureocillium takamizusanense]|uniref:Glutathione transferase n=1 Tax=Purpureocillium takamizusanense TaxID=2060973 RepID=A0A9Q8V9E7_9HYPO|nr:Glutathione transferase [Purpureocillium takamizusanense]UNI18170.1 Glutathione transferase [Purpureocillium takamizusanense]